MRLLLALLVFASLISGCGSDAPRVKLAEPVQGEVLPPPPPNAPVAQIERHSLSVTLDPVTHGISASDEIEFSGAGVQEIDLSLNPGFEIISVASGRLAAAWTFHDGVLRVTLPAPSAARFTVSVSWKGTLFDPPKSGEMRFVTGESSKGTIQPEGAWLPEKAGWYPDLEGSMARFTVTAKVPEDWEFVGQGSRHEYDAKTRRSVWCDPVPSDGLTCVAGPLVSEELKSGRLTIRSFFAKEDLAIAAEYRRASVEWIEHFSELLAPYPYDDFSIVENFFSTGYGMPGYTLLGADVVRMGARYLGEGGLGHEILHSWWGNSVFVEGGNWCEALTTYGSNYHWVEVTQGPDAARKYRRHQMVRFSMNVDPATEYPVRKFEGKTTEADNEIGYGKGAMLFHAVRKRIGDAPFWAGLRRLIAAKTGRRATWDDFRQAFEIESGESLEGLFTAWLDLPGANTLTVTRTETGLRLDVDGPVRDFRVKVRAFEEDGPHDHDVEVKDGRATWDEPEGTTRVTIDPEFDMFRRLEGEALPRCLNRVVSDQAHAVVLPEGDPAVWKELLARLEGWEQIPSAEATPGRLAGKSILVLGGPDTNALAKRWVESDALKLGSISITADGWTTTEEKVALGQNRAVLVSFANPDDPLRHATLFFPASPEAASAARLLLYYGWESWFVWRDGKIAARGEFPVSDPLSIELK